MTAAEVVAPEPWEEAYLRFETPEEERRKFTRRLEQFGAASWSPDSVILDLCCGRGGGIVALEGLGFRRLVGVDLSPGLVSHYKGPSAISVGDVRALPIADETVDVAVVHGGLHHLIDLLPDLDRTLVEVHRVLHPAGRFAFVEPWRTPFLRLVHAASNRATLRRVWSKLDALESMIEHERTTYEQWLRHPDEVRASVAAHFETEWEAVRLGKWHFLGRKR